MPKPTTDELAADGVAADDLTAAERAAAELEAGRHLFAQNCRFIAGAATLAQLPPATVPEVAFAGRSNVGKSSLINALTGRRTLARISNTPGRTQQLNFFELGARLILVDLPGYGYAKVSKTQSKAWTRLLRDFLRGRVPLRRACVLVDARHGLKEPDREIMALLDAAAVSYQIVLTKTDKCGSAELVGMTAQIQEQIRRHPAALPTPIATSANEATGIPELRAALAALASDPGLN